MEVHVQCVASIEYSLLMHNYYLLRINAACSSVAELDCSASGVADVVIDCQSLDLQTTLLCSFNGGPLHPCERISFIPNHNEVLIYINTH